MPLQLEPEALPAWIPPAAAAVYVAFAVALVLVLRHLGLVGSRAPPRGTLGDDELRVRRKLRTWLALDFLVVFPAAVLLLVLAALDRARSGTFVRIGFGLLAFLAPLPALYKELREHERRRAEGSVVSVATGERTPAPRSDRGLRGTGRRVR
jgi:hypothetical protein